MSAYVSNNPVPANQLPGLIGDVHVALKRMAEEATPEKPETLQPALPIKKSVTPDHVICLKD